MASSNVVPAENAFSWSIRKIAKAFRVGRETVARKIEENGVVPDSYEVGHPVYAIHKIAPILYRDTSVAPDGERDPHKMEPKDRWDWIKGSREWDALLLDRKQLIKSDEIREENSEILRRLMVPIEGLPEELERLFNFSGDQVEMVEQIIDQVRQSICDELQKVEVDECMETPDS